MYRKKYEFGDTTLYFFKDEGDYILKNGYINNKNRYDRLYCRRIKLGHFGFHLVKKIC